MKIVLATHNHDKLGEMLPLLQHLDIQLDALDTHPQVKEILEDGKTLEDNALIKARTVYQLTGLPALADDTGLEVEYLNGKPGVHTGRFAGKNATYDQNVDKLLKVMESVPEKNRNARFVTVMAFVDGERELMAEGFVEGRLLTERKGVGGFGYDPVFYIPNLNKTFAEMTLDEKSKISHRGRAIQKMIHLLEASFSLSQSNPNLNHTRS